MGKTIKNVFVTGATGFIGSHLLQKLREELADSSLIYVLTREPVDFGDQRIRNLVGELQKIDEFVEELKNSNYVFHLAAEAGFNDAVDYETVNFGTVKKLVEILDGSSNLENFIFTSTIGAVDRAATDLVDRPLNSKSVPAPQSAYGRSKLRAEECIRQSKLPFTIIRPTWVYGKDMRTRSHVSQFVSWVYDGNPIIYLNFPGQVSLIHVNDLARAMVACIDNQAVLNKTYFAETESMSLGKIFSVIYENITGNKLRQLPVPRFSFLFRKIHSKLPLSISNLFLDYLRAEDNSFRKDLLHDNFYTLADKIFDVISSHAYNSGYWLVTGAGNGIGFELAKRLNSAGKNLILIDKDPQKIYGIGRHLVIKCDLSDENQIRELVTKIQKYKIFALINNAGIGFKGDFDKVSAECHLATIKVNVVASVLLTKLLLMNIQKNGGHIVNIISSVAGTPLPGMAVYAAAKSFLLEWSVALSAELKNKCHVLTFSPSGTQTNFQKHAGVKETAGLMLPEYVANQIYAAIKKKKTFVFLGLRNKLFVYLMNFLPIRFQVMVWGILFKGLR